MATFTSKIPGDELSRCAEFGGDAKTRINTTGFVQCPAQTPPVSVPASSPAVNQTPIPSQPPPVNVPASSPAVNQTPNPTQPPDPNTVTGPATATSGAASHKNGLAGGPVAGIAIGCLLAGVLIAGIVFFFLLRRQKRRQYTSRAVSHLPPANYTSGLEKGPVVVASAVPSGIDNLLPQPESDDTITGEVSKIRDNIKNHIRTYCHSAPLAGGINEAALHNLASAAGVSSSALVAALSNPSRRQETLRLVFAWVILSKSTGGRNTDLLPLEVAKLSGAITGSDIYNSKDLAPELVVAQNNMNITEHTALYSKWKTITGFLLQQGMGKNAQDTNRVQAFARIIAELDSIVAPCVQGSLDDAQRRKNLDMILTRTANFAFLLFSQPGSFQFDFGSRRGGICAFPTLLQTIGDQGQILSPPRILSEGEIVAA